MSASRISPSWLLAVLTVLSVLSAQARALHVYMEGQQQKCFFEELPKDTLVVGKNLLVFELSRILLADSALQEPTTPRSLTEIQIYG